MIGLSGHGLLELGAYDAFLSDRLEDDPLSDEASRRHWPGSPRSRDDQAHRPGHTVDVFYAPPCTSSHAVGSARPSSSGRGCSGSS